MKSVRKMLHNTSKFRKFEMVTCKALIWRNSGMRIQWKCYKCFQVFLQPKIWIFMEIDVSIEDLSILK